MLELAGSQTPRVTDGQTKAQGRSGAAQALPTAIPCHHLWDAMGSQEASLLWVSGQGSRDLKKDCTHLETSLIWPGHIWWPQSKLRV